ncbi:MAG: DUF58 domain-containing protein [Planctomycetes bacterium]|nr:DUF58 domain-containing protein [Planctomycetota bacterium]
MVTSRGWWFLGTVLVLLALAVLPHQPNLSLGVLSLTLLLWFAGEWLVFVVRARILSRRLRVFREVRDARGPVATLWAGRLFQVVVELRLSSPAGLPYVAFADFLPFAADQEKGELKGEGMLDPAHPLPLQYTIRCPAPGQVRFEGVRVQLADLQGFFYHATFVPGVRLYPVLPPLVDAEGRTAMVKRHNLLPPPGVHRLPRPGIGSELLDLRDYMPGDPPRTIAWKISARRDRLITKEFESEVPVRCTLFVDTSNSVRVGPPGENALTNLVEIAAAVAQANSSSRDLTGLCLFDEQRASAMIRPGRGARHLVHLLGVLTDAAGLAPTTGRANLNTLLPLAYAFAREVYPELLRSDVNRVPLWLPWLAPTPAYTFREPTLGQRLYGRLPFLLTLLAVVVLVLLGLVGSLVWALSSWRVRTMFPFAFLSMAALSGLLFGLLVLPRMLFSRQRRLYRWRKQLAALLSVHFGLAPGGLAVLQEDSEQLALYLQYFLAEHQIPYALPLYDPQGRYLFAAPGKVEVLAKCLLRALGKGHDNELFVLLVDLLELSDQLGPLLRAVKVALARHHQVLVICPWPRGLLLPDSQHAGDRQGRRDEDDAGPVRLQRALRQATTQRYHQAFHQARRTFAHLGVPMVCARSGDPAHLILERLDRLRSVRRLGR